jgi:hypothetical protein
MSGWRLFAALTAAFVLGIFVCARWLGYVSDGVARVAGLALVLAFLVGISWEGFKYDFRRDFHYLRSKWRRKAHEQAPPGEPTTMRIILGMIFVVGFLLAIAVAATAPTTQE